MTNRKEALSVLVSTLAFTLIGLAGTHASAQSTSTSTTATSPVSFVYVSTAPTTTSSNIHGYAASSTGALAATPGSPYSTNRGSYMAVNGKWLFDTNGVDIRSFSIGAEGALHAGPEVNAQQYSPCKTSGGPGDLFLDHTGATLYDGFYYIDCANNGYQSFSIVQTTGQAEFKQNVPPYNESAGPPLSFISNNEYAYTANCYHGTPTIIGYSRASSGDLTSLSINPSIPPTGVAGTGYCPYLAAADTTGHVAISMTPTEYYSSVGPPQVATYTATATGNLTTTSTASNMPKTSLTSVLDMEMAPSGKLLAVAGAGGVQVLHWNGASPATHYTGLLTTNQVEQMGWDNNNHLYAISRSTGKLYVWTVTLTSVTAAPGSPHSIVNPQDLAVLPK